MNQNTAKQEAEPTYTRRHMCMNIEGALRNYGKKSMAGLITEDSGAEWTDKMVRNYLQECLAKGYRVIPMGDCEGFDYQKGCPGHPITKEQYEEKQ